MTCNSLAYPGSKLRRPRIRPDVHPNEQPAMRSLCLFSGTLPCAKASSRSPTATGFGIRRSVCHFICLIWVIRAAFLPPESFFRRIPYRFRSIASWGETTTAGRYGRGADGLSFLQVRRQRGYRPSGNRTGEKMYVFLLSQGIILNAR